MRSVLFPGANEQLELEKENSCKETNSNDLKSFLGIMLFIVVVLSYLMISERDSKIKVLQDNKFKQEIELFKYKKEVLIQNENVLTKYLKDNFHDLKEYRVIYLNNDHLTVIINEPIKTTKNEIGYSKENWYEVRIELAPNSFKVIEHSKIFKNYENENIEKKEPIHTHSFIENGIIDAAYKIFTFICSFFFDVEEGKKILNGINQMVINVKIESIEEPILFKAVTQQKVQ